MNNKYVIGIDIGGTNTDAVLVDWHEQIVYSCKTPTTPDIVSGFTKAIAKILHEAQVSPSSIKELLVGTTHATNALLQKKDLATVGVIRIAGNQPMLPPCYAWPVQAREAMFKGMVTVNGGFECHGASITPFCPSEVKQATHTLLQQGAESIAIVGVFSPLNNEQELMAQRIVHDIAGKEFPVTISSGLGGVGFIERENSAILNSALKKSILNGFKTLQKALTTLNINARLFITQNNGTVISLDQALEYPVLTLSGGPTNSFIGACRLAKLSDAIVADIGGTSTDVGMVLTNFPRRTLNNSHIAGITLNFPMPDVISVSLGGGSYITSDNNNAWHIGPLSSGAKVLEESYSFGGKHFTLTDVAIVCDAIKIEHADPVRVPLTNDQARAIMKQARTIITSIIHQIAGPKKTLPIILVGGGAHLIPTDLLAQYFSVCIPPHAHVANAYGAALAEISGTIDAVVSLTQRDMILNKLQEEALQLAIAQGADKNTTRIVNQQIVPFHYVPNNMARVIITAAGKRIW